MQAESTEETFEVTIDALVVGASALFGVLRKGHVIREQNSAGWLLLAAVAAATTALMGYEISQTCHSNGCDGLFNISSTRWCVTAP